MHVALFCLATVNCDFSLSFRSRISLYQQWEKQHELSILRGISATHFERYLQCTVCRTVSIFDNKIYHDVSFYELLVHKQSLFYRMIRNTACCKHRKERKPNESSFPKTGHAPGEIYDQVKENAVYQELEEVSKQTIYEKIK